MQRSRPGAQPQMKCRMCDLFKHLKYIGKTKRFEPEHVRGVYEYTIQYTVCFWKFAFYHLVPQNQAKPHSNPRDLVAWYSWSKAMFFQVVENPV